MMLNVVLLLGGKSPEREVSLVSGKEIAKQLIHNGHKITELDPVEFATGHELIKAIADNNPDLVFIGLHGGDGENGVLQAMLSGSNICHTGSDFKASAVAMDKLLSKFIANQAGVPVPQYLIINKSEYLNGTFCTYRDCLFQLTKDKSNNVIVIKPIDSGSSVGVHIIDNAEQWDLALKDAFKFSHQVIAEEFIEGRELTVTVLDGKALSVVEIIPHNGFYDYPNKYTKGNTTYQTPANLSENETTKVQQQAVYIWQAMQCSGYARIDFRYNGKEFYFLEVNTLPGMTPLSLTPMAAKAMGLDFGDLLDKIMDVALTSKKEI